MAKIHRLTGAEWREWRLNNFLLIDPKGDVLRDAHPDEARAKLPVTVDGVSHSIVRARDYLMEYFWKTYGNVQLRIPNGRILATVRDPSTPRQKGELRKCPPPRHCECRKWNGVLPGKHHAQCNNNALAPIAEQHPEWRLRKQSRERVFIGKSVRDEVELLGANEVVTVNAPIASDSPASVELAVAAKIPLVSPEGCQCEKWEGAKPGKHAEICIYKPAWEASLPPSSELDELDSLIEEDEMVLFSVRKREVSRTASDEEKHEALSNEVPLISVDGEDYLVIPRSEVRGERQKATG